MKKILFLGAGNFQVSAIKKAKELGYYVITTDYLPNNPGHKYADKSFGISTIDMEEIYQLAKSEKVDGIISYASDVSACAAAYASEKLGLPTNPFKSVEILTKKHLFKKFMVENGFLVPRGMCFQDKNEASKYFKELKTMAMVKPVDSSGSKGVHKVASIEEFDKAWEDAMTYSISKNVLVEEYIQRKGYQIDGDGFMSEGEIVYFGVMDQHQDKSCNLYAPVAESIPSVQEKKIQRKAQSIIQDIMSKLNMQFGAFNMEYIVDENENVYVLEVGPRNGGNYIPDTVKVALEIDMMEASIRYAVGDDYVFPEPKEEKCATSYMIHSLETGKFVRLEISEEIKDAIVKTDLFILEGEKVHGFRNGGDTIGAMVLQFNTIEDMIDKIEHMNDYLKVIVEEI